MAQGANLIFFIPASISAIVASRKDNLINYKIGIPITIFGTIGAIIGASISTKMEVNVLRKYFGLFLLIIAIYEIYLLIKEYKNNKNKA